MKVFTLGTGGFIPTVRRETSSYLVQRGGGAVLFDAGTGVKNLAKLDVERHFADLDRLDVVVTHFHLDHISGLTWLLRLWPRRIVIHVPSTPLVEVDGVQAVMEYTSPPYFSLPLTEWPQSVSVVPITSDSISLPVGTLSVMPQQHSGGSIALKLGGLGYVTDTFPSRRHVDFLQETDLLLIDTMHDRQEYEGMTARGVDLDHGYSVGNSRLAEKAGVQRLGLVHIDPSYDDIRVEILTSEAREIFPHVFIPDDGDVYTVTDH